MSILGIRVPRVIVHPVMGWFIIILLATITAIPFVYFLWSPRAATIVSIAGMVIAFNWALVNVLYDWIKR